ncbi:hypothetical protein [Pseudomonas sp. LFS044]|uniref:hypothetical protein n=1 Tax=Pseudomonas sp. LFS044 TaxID=3229880 RepID=UPI003A809B78
MRADPSRLTAIEHKMLLEDLSSSSTQIEDLLEHIVCGQSTLVELVNLLGPFAQCEAQGDVQLPLWKFFYTERGFELSDPQVLSVAIDVKGCVSVFALV